jgi:pimeloyl-ACP methyl ester carboxylesterase
VRVLRRGLIFIGAGFLCLCAACEVFCQATLKPPRRFPNVPILSLPGEDPAWRTVVIPARDHVSLEASFVSPKDHSTKCVLMLHGITDNRDGMRGFVPLFTSHGYRVLLPDVRGNGNSGGELITYGLLEKYDAIDWAHWLRSEGCQTIYGFGESLGAAILIQSSAVDPIFKSIVAEGSYADLRGVGEYRVQRLAPLPAWLAKPLAETMMESALLYARVRFGVDLSHVSPVADIARTLTPILLIHGLGDLRTPAWNSEQLAKANPRAVLWLVPGAEHGGASRTQPEEFNRRVLEWFAGS